MYLFSTAQVASEVHVRGVPDRFIDDCERFGRTADVLMPAVARSHAPVHDALLGSWEWWTSTTHYRQLGEPYALAHYLLAPVVTGGRLVGSIHLVRRSGEGAFGPNDLALASAMSLHVSTRLASLRAARSALATWAPMLTRRQMDTAELIVKGLTSREIAAALGLSVDGVKKHVRDLFRKLNVGSRAELATVLHTSSPASAPAPKRRSRGLPGNSDALVHYWPERKGARGVAGPA